MNFPQKKTICDESTEQIYKEILKRPVFGMLNIIQFIINSFIITE